MLWGKRCSQGLDVRSDQGRGGRAGDQIASRGVSGIDRGSWSEDKVGGGELAGRLECCSWAGW